jgi:hypothetical protein
MSLVFQNIDPPTPLSARRVCTPRLCWGGGGGGHTRQAERGVGGQYFGRREIGLPSYSNNLSTVPDMDIKNLEKNQTIMELEGCVY